MVFTINFWGFLLIFPSILGHLPEELPGLEVILQVEGLVLLNKASGVLTEDLLLVCLEPPLQES